MVLKMALSSQLWYVVLIYIVFVFIASIHLTLGNDNVKCIERERQALLSFKRGVQDSYGTLLSWRSETEDCCNWQGVKCHNLTNHVIELHLRGTFGSIDEEYYLSGKIGLSLIGLAHLQYLDLSANKLEDTPIPDYFGSFVHLEYLNLSRNSFSGVAPPHLGNLSSLHTLDLSRLYDVQILESPKWLSRLTSLEHLDLRGINLQKASDWMEVVNELPHLETLILSHCSLPSPIFPSYHPFVNVSASLSKLDLGWNQLTSSIFILLSNLSTSLVYLDLSFNNLQGFIPNTFGNLTSLSFIEFSYNQLEGPSPKSFWNFCNLQSLSFSGNEVQGAFSNFLQILPRCALNSLQLLDFTENKISGPLPNFSTFLNLKRLYLHSNNFSGTIPLSLGKLSNLEHLNLRRNSLEGSILEAHFSKLTKLRGLYLSYNSLSFHPHPQWALPFQLDVIDLSSCRLGPKFPNWLQGQNLSSLFMSNASISDTAPQWFWDLSPNLDVLDLSMNKIKGRLPTSLKGMRGSLGYVILGSNELEGQIPLYLSQAYQLDISNNKFSAGLNFVCGNNEDPPLRYLDISDNQLSGELPNCWENLSNLRYLSLAGNGFSGGIPNSLSSLSRLESLQLHNNSFSGEFPSWLKNFGNLKFLSLEGNSLSGPIPAWIGNKLPNLIALSLRSNQFYGHLPPSLCHLQRVQLLDLSLNNITGGIPSCIHNLSFLTSSRDQQHDFSMFRVGMFSDSPIAEMIMTWKGREYNIKENLKFLKSIDFSGNHFTGAIPNEITKLVELVALNLSRNNLTGGIPEKIGQLKSLDFLDLSRNELVGHIPSSLSQIDRLSVLDLSYNKLSGEIPTSTQLQSFNQSTYVGNIGLCGSPLPRCPGEEKVPDSTQKWEEAKDENEFQSRGFYISLTLGFVLGFWGICGSLMFHRPWRRSYFKFLSGLNDWCYVKVVIFRNKVQKRFRE